MIINSPVPFLNRNDNKLTCHFLTRYDNNDYLTNPFLTRNDNNDNWLT